MLSTPQPWGPYQADVLWTDMKAKDLEELAIGGMGFVYNYQGLANVHLAVSLSANQALTGARTNDGGVLGYTLRLLEIDSQAYD